MRVTTLLRRMIGVTELIVEAVLFTVHDDVSVSVRPRWRLPRCGKCHRPAPGYDRRPLRCWEHLCLVSRAVNSRHFQRRLSLARQR